MRRPAPRFGTQKCGSGEGGPEMVTFICKFCCECNEKVPLQDGTSLGGQSMQNQYWERQLMQNHSWERQLMQTTLGNAS